MEQAKIQKYGTFFPYSHMSVSDLLNAAEASDSPLAKVLAARLEEADEELEGARLDHDQELTAAGDELREAQDRIETLERELEELEEKLGASVA